LKIFPIAQWYASPFGTCRHKWSCPTAGISPIKGDVYVMANQNPGQGGQQ
jgi:hypothetical protein